MDRLDQGSRARLAELLGRFGSNPISFLTLYQAPWSLYESERVDGAVPYVEVHRTALAWGDPLCDPDDTSSLVAEFTAAMRARRLRVCFVAVQEGVAEHAMELGHAVVKIGEEPVFDLPGWHRPRGDGGKHLRWALNRARRAGALVEEYRPGERRDRALERDIVAARASWERALGRRPVRSFMRSAPLAEAERKRIFVARVGGRVVAVLACAPVYGRGGWYLEDLVRTADAPLGATELLVVEALERLGTGGATFATLGIAPLRGAERQMDRRARRIAGILRLVFDRFDRRYHFASLSRFKAKFRPSGWEARYVTFDPPRPSVGLIRAVVSVLDPRPGPDGEEIQPTPAAVGGRVLVAVQAAAVGLASLAVVAGERIGSPVGPAPLVAPVGLAGIVVAALLVVLAARLGRGDGPALRAMALVLEGLVVVATVGRLQDHRGVPLDLVSLAVAAGVLVLMFRSGPRESGDPDPVADGLAH